MKNTSVIHFFFFLLSLLTTFQLHQQIIPLNSRAERAALIQLRSSLGLKTKDWPIKSDPCLTWIGVHCQHGSVNRISISGLKRTRVGNQNTSFTVDSLANFTNLVLFNASGFSLHGSMPNWFGFRLQSLRVLDLRFCGISGGIPVSVGNMSNLSELYLSDNNLVGSVPSSLGVLSRLSVLDLSRNALTGVIPSSFGSLLNLRYLNVCCNSLSSLVPTQLGNLASLVVLDLSSNSFTGTVPIEFGSLMNLERMVIRNNSFAGDLPDALWSLPALTFLDASDNHFMGSLPDKRLNANVNMGVFNLSHNMFYGVVTSVLRRVSSVDLSYNYFQGKMPDYARDVAVFDKNCFRSLSGQRNVKQCATFYTMRGLPFDNFGLPNGTLPLPLHGHKNNRRMFVIAVVFGTLGLILPFVILVTSLIICRKRRKTTLKVNGSGPVSIERAYGEVFVYEKIVAATDDFNDENLIKNGYSCDVFSGVLENGIRIIIKRFDAHSVKNSYMEELDFCSKVSHPRFVPLLGRCLENEKEKFLIYKHMPKGDLSSSLSRINDRDDERLTSLDWITRLKIAVGTAEGLSYLHHECFPPLVHRDVQASSILLDDKYEARLGSLSKVCTQEDNIHSNWIKTLISPPLASQQSASVTATCAYDVYCFGKVLLELVTGETGISGSSGSETNDLLKSILPYISTYDKELVTNIIDQSLTVDDDLLEEVWAVAVIAKSCLNPKPSRRPLMRFILKALENPSKVVRAKTTSSAKLRVKSFMGSWMRSNG
ncbi:probable LRR receptor-like serine/threonine-protein kinase At2g16250 [Helianthus annuus]|uniref:probable LRR receptor-like serine/threonine-protein kinase At2g16250 n=1 Tax=Helianthus annuus TaxID=4232 RepID=UPI000B8FF6D2|nr:probable LRR receptor-like serine/threonine-protein kinase At2g16250 [Helianthus annuus]